MQKIILDKYEQEIEDAIANGEYFSVPKTEFKKSKSITLRVKNEDLITVKSKARGVGIPYQRIINMLINGYANDRIKLAI